jgi:membrane protease YdiL (CAAX protease family)
MSNDDSAGSPSTGRASGPRIDAHTSPPGQVEAEQSQFGGSATLSPPVQMESAWRLIAAAVGWILLSGACGTATGALTALFALGYHVRKVSGITSLAGILGFAGMLSVAAIVRGRIVGFGNIKSGLGNNPVSRLPIIVCLAVIIVGYVALLSFVLPGVKLSDAVVRTLHSLSTRAAVLVAVVFFLEQILLGVIAPIAEESLFRGWLWTGLQRHWAVLPTALLTSTFWLALHVEREYPLKPLVLVPVAIILALARHLGKSVRAPIALHMIYNLSTAGARWL